MDIFLEEIAKEQMRNNLAQARLIGMAMNGNGDGLQRIDDQLRQVRGDL